MRVILEDRFKIITNFASSLGSMNASCWVCRRSESGSDIRHHTKFQMALQFMKLT
jgi:hypothetical protein